MERQIGIIEGLLKDKAMLQDKVEELINKVRVKDNEIEATKTDLISKYQAQLKKEKESWSVQEKIRKEKWEQEKIQQIRTGAFQQLEPTIQSLIDKNKEEVRKAFEECERRVELIKA